MESPISASILQSHEQAELSFKTSVTEVLPSEITLAPLGKPMFDTKLPEDLTAQDKPAPRIKAELTETQLRRVLLTPNVKLFYFKVYNQRVTAKVTTCWLLWDGRLAVHWVRRILSA